MYTKKCITIKINGRGSETRTHTGRILSPLSLPLDYAPVRNGGSGGIRTHGTREGTSDFKSGTLNRAQPRFPIFLDLYVSN